MTSCFTRCALQDLIGWFPLISARCYSVSSDIMTLFSRHCGCVQHSFDVASKPWVKAAHWEAIDLIANAIYSNEWYYSGIISHCENFQCECDFDMNSIIWVIFFHLKSLKNFSSLHLDTSCVYNVTIEKVSQTEMSSWRQGLPVPKRVPEDPHVVSSLMSLM